MSRDDPRKEFRADEVAEMLQLYFIHQERIMTALADLQASVAALTTEVGLAVAALHNPPVVVGTADADLVPLTAAVGAATASLAAALAPAPATPAEPAAPTPPAA